MPPDSDTTTHILLNGLLWYAVLAGIPTARWLLHRITRSARRSDQRVNLHAHRALHPNVTVIHPTLNPRNPR